MSKHDDGVTLRQMLDHAREAAALVVGRKRSDLDAERVLTLALMQLMQIVGEAASRVSDAGTRAHPEVPWAQIVAFRNRLIHGYDSIDLDRLWQIVTGDLPVLITQLEVFTPPKM